MKVLQINAVYGYKSTGLIVRDIYNASMADGIDAYAAYQFTSERVENGIGLGNWIDRKIHALRTRIDGKQGYSSKCVTHKFIKKLREIKPDVIHLHNLHANYINLPLLMDYCAVNGVKVMITLHDSWLFTGKCYHFADIGCDKYTSGCGDCPKRKKDIPSWFKDNSAAVWQDRVEMFSRLKDLVIVGCSDWMSDNARRFPGFYGRRIITIRNGIDTDVFTPCVDAKARHGVEGKFVILGMANKWRLPENADAVKRIVEGLNDNEIIFLVGCEDADEQRFEGNEKIRTFGYISAREELAYIYSASDVFVNLSLIDTLPTVNMEAIASGTPVITYDVGGGPELVRDGVTGFIVPLLDADAVISAIGAVKNGAIDRGECARIGKIEFCKDNNYKRYIEEYHLI